MNPGSKNVGLKMTKSIGISTISLSKHGVFTSRLKTPRRKIFFAFCHVEKRNYVEFKDRFDVDWGPDQMCMVSNKPVM